MGTITEPFMVDRDAIADEKSLLETVKSRYVDENQ
jgi:hypothetical protein